LIFLPLHYCLKLLLWSWLLWLLPVASCFCIGICTSGVVFGWSFQFPVSL
jgi:hypothetical protein